MVSDDDYLYFVDQALDGMAAILVGLGDELAHELPALAGAKPAVRHNGDVELR